MKKKYSIRVSSCDDYTEIEVELTKAEAKLVKKIADKITETSSYCCMPKMYISEVK